MSRKARVKGFRFKGFDENDNPIIRDNDDREVDSQPSPPPGEKVATIEIYHENPTWICIGGRCYRIG